MNRRGFLLGIAGILATATAPAIVKAANIMPVHAPLPEWLSTSWVYDDQGGLWRQKAVETAEEIRSMVLTFAVKIDEVTKEHQAQLEKLDWNTIDWKRDSERPQIVLSTLVSP